MKRFYLILFSLSLLASACSVSEEDIAPFVLGTPSPEVPSNGILSDGGVFTIAVQFSKEWEIISYSTGCTATTSDVSMMGGGNLIVTVEENPNYDSREISVTIASKSTSHQATWSATQQDRDNLGRITTISTASELKTLATEVNDGDSKIGQCYRLANNIDLEGSAINPWVPIGERYDSFEGVFDGNGYTVSGIYINSKDDYQGFLGYSEGTIMNLTVEGTISGDDNIGGIAGYSNGDISNCHSSVTINNSSSYIGGIVGAAYGTISECSFSGTIISSSSSYVAGICGYTWALITECFNSGYISAATYISGIAGYGIGTTIFNCYNAGTIYCSSNYGSGILGSSANTSSVVAYCYNTGSITGTANYTGGITANNQSVSLSDCYTLEGSATVKNYGDNGEEKTESEMTSTAIVTLLNDRQSPTVWDSDSKPYINSGYPVLVWQL